MTSPEALLATGVVLCLATVWGSLSYVHPELAFRLESLVLPRTDELTSFTVFVHKAGGLIVVSWLVVLPPILGELVLLIPVLLGAAMPPLYFYLTRGTFVVQSVMDAV